MFTWADSGNDLDGYDEEFTACDLLLMVAGQWANCHRFIQPYDEAFI